MITTTLLWWCPCWWLTMGLFFEAHMFILHTLTNRQPRINPVSRHHITTSTSMNSEWGNSNTKPRKWARQQLNSKYCNRIGTMDSTQWGQWGNPNSIALQHSLSLMRKYLHFYLSTWHSLLFKVALWREIVMLGWNVLLNLPGGFACQGENNLTLCASTLSLDGLEVDGGHGVDQLHGQSVHQTAGPLVPASPLQKQPFDPYSILKRNTHIFLKEQPHFRGRCLLVQSDLYRMTTSD